MQDNDTIQSSASRIAVIIPVFNRMLITLNCLEQLTANERKNIDIVVVDDGSKDGTAEAIRIKYPAVHIVYGSGSWWYTRSVNEGLRYALKNTSCDYFLLLNNDIDLGYSYLDIVHGILDKYKNELTIFGSVSFNAENIIQPVFLGIRKFIPWRNKQYCYSYSDYMAALHEGKEVLDSAFLPGRGMFFSKKTLLHNGLLDEGFPQYASDYEFSARSNTAGIKTRVCLHAILYSHEKLTGAGSPKNKPGFYEFLSSLFNKYSPTYPINNYKLIRQHTGTPLLMPLSFLFVLSGKFKAYFKYKYLFLK